MKSGFSAGAAISYIIALFFIGLGFHKIFVYENPDSILRAGRNVYVGGDAYNYIINANYATAYFALAVFCAVVGMTFVIVGVLDNKLGNKELTTTDNESSIAVNE